MLRHACILSALLTSSALAFAQSREPILRIETETHTGAIGRIALSKGGKFLITSSEDRTVRVWERPSGRLLRVLRPPIGAGNEGKLFGAALSPDGKTVACGGWTGVEWDKSASVYFFDRERGDITNRITGIPNTIMHIAYSPMGDRIAVALGGKGGIRLYNSATLQQVAADTDYAESSNYLEFDSGGRILAAAEDGYLRLYDPSLKLIKKARAPGANRPISAKFSPDAKRIAVGYGDSAVVDILSAPSLTLEYSADTKNIQRGTFGNVAWSPDGAALFAGGSFRRGPISIRKWADAGRGVPSDLPAADNTISDLIALDTGGMIFSTFGGEVAELDADGKSVMKLEPAVLDNRLNQRKVPISADGSVIKFLMPSLRKTVAFSVNRREYLPYAQIPQTTYANTYKAPLYTEGVGEVAPLVIARKRVTLDPGELCYSGAVTNDAQKAFIGTSWALRLYDATGNLIWKTSAPSVAFAVNVTADGKTGMAAFGDGTFRWYDLDNGKELLAFLPHSDGKRWILWTPDGKFDCSPGAEALIGWHVNNGKARAADFFPAGRFRKKYYRPEQMAPAIGLKNEGPHLASTDAAPPTPIENILPPIVQIVSPADGASISAAAFTVRYSVRAPSGQPITRVRAMVDGRPVADSRNLTITPNDDGSVKEIQIQIPPRDCEIGVLAENQHAVSEPSTVRIKWTAPQNQQEFSVKPKLYLLAIGVSNYKNPQFKLEFAAKDARDFADAMTKQHGRLYREVVTRVLVDEKAGRDDILDGLEWIQKQTTSRDVAMVFLSGHGILDTTRTYYYAPVGIELDKLRRTGLPFSEIKSTVEALAGKALFFVDTCHAGNAIGTTRAPVSTDAIVNELASAENGAVVFCSSTGRQLSLEKAEWGNGAFTKALIEGLSGKADLQKTGRITVNMLDFYISERVKELTGGSQTPATAKPATVPDFPLAVIGALSARSGYPAP